MAKANALFNIKRMLNESEKDTPIEVSFLQDLDYTLRQMNTWSSGYYFKEVSSEKNPELFNTSDGNFVNVITLDKLPEKCDKENIYENNHILYHTNDQKYYIGVFSDGKPSKRYKPSDMHCLRSMYYQIIGANPDEEQQKSGDFYGICESGTDRHLRVQTAISLMRKYGVDCDYVDVEEYIKENNLQHLVVEKKKQYETKVYDKNRNIIFLCDGILKYKGQYFVFEFKTESSYKWMNRESVDDSHKYQAYTYSLELGIDKVLFIYENRDICTKKSYILSVTDENKQFIENRIKNCDSYVNQKIAPPIEESVTKKNCQYCSYKRQCKVDGK